MILNKSKQSDQIILYNMLLRKNVEQMRNNSIQKIQKTKNKYKKITRVHLAHIDDG